MAHILILGLEKALAEQLGRVLRQTHEVRTADSLDGSASEADLIFSGAEGGRYHNVLADIRRLLLDIPVVVVSRFPETRQWLDALEAGAFDYCAAPFEQRQLGWILDGALRRAA